MPSTANFIGGCVTLFFSCAISAAGGVGGGGINVPVLLLIFGYSLDTSIALSLCVVLGNAFAQSLLNIRKTHPKRLDKPLIYWDLVNVLLPAQMGGSNIGTIFAAMVPDSVTYVLALVLLLFASAITMQKGMHKYQDEQAGKLTSKSMVTDVLSPFAEDLIAAEHTDKRSFEVDNKPNLSQPSDGKVQIKWPINILRTIGIMWICYTVILIARVLVNRCSPAYVVCYLCMYLPLIGAIVAFYKLNIHNQEQIAVSELHPIDFHTKLPFLLMCGFFIGIVCSMLGIGGGEMLSPLILSMHVTPAVTSATTATMSFLNTLSNIIRAGMRHQFPVGVGLLLMFIGFLGGLTGRKLGLYISHEYNRSSFIVFALAGVLSLTCIYYLAKLASSKFDSEWSEYC